MKKFTKIVLQVIIGISAILTLSAGKVMALTVQEGAEAARAEGMPAELIGENGNGVFQQFSNLALAIVGFLSVVMLIWGGLRYITSGGDSKEITDAKNTILYAIIGLIIAVLSFAIINFVLQALKSVTTPSETSFILTSLLG